MVVQLNKRALIYNDFCKLIDRVPLLALTPVRNVLQGLVRQINLQRIAITCAILFVQVVGWKGGMGQRRQKGKGREIVTKSRRRPQATSKHISHY